MRAPRWLALCLPALLLLAGGWRTAQQQGSVGVAGQVSNGTSGHSVPAGLEITLFVVTGMEETSTYATLAAADRTFRFDGVVAEAGDVLVARATYQGVHYTSDFVTLEPDQGDVSLPLVVYETTEDPTGVSINQAHIFISPTDEQLRFEEIYLVGNDGDRTYVGSNDTDARRITVSYSLPAGAEGLELWGSNPTERYIVQGSRILDSEPVRPGPGTSGTRLNYALRRQGDVHIIRSFDLPVASVIVILSADGLALAGDSIAPAGTLDTETGPALSYTAGPLAAGELLDFTLVASGHRGGSPSGAGAGSSRNTAYEVSAGLAVLAGAMVAASLLWRSPAPGPPPAWSRASVDAIAALDERYQAGDVTEKIYRRRRERLLAEFRETFAAQSDD